MFEYASHHLSSEQIRFLNRGPTYVIPCQMHVLSTSSLTLGHILTNQIMPLRQQLTKLFTKYPVDPECRRIFRRDMERQFVQSFSQPIPSAIEQRAFYEKQLLQSIQSELKRDHHHQLILRRTADEYNRYYLGDLDDFNQMAHDHIENNSHCYEMIGVIDQFNSEQQHLTKIIQSIDAAIEQLARKKFIPADHLNKLQIGQKTDINLPYLYFLPKIHPNSQVVLQPRLSSCKNAPVQTLVLFLDQLLRSLFENYSQSTTFLDGHDFLQKLQHYCLQVDCFTPKTTFVTFQIHHLYTRVSHADLLSALNGFLVHQLGTHGRHQRFTIDAIVELTALVLRHHIFTYNGKIYRYLKGSPLNFAFTQLLADIYLQHWQMPLVRQIRTADKFYGRYHDTGIFTWNETSYPLHLCINELNEQNPDIQLTTSVGVHVHFLHVYIENQQGLLYTRVYHDPMIEPFLLPYAADHPRLIHRQWFRFALVRAGQYCSSFDDFQKERVQIELTFLVNGYSLDFVQFHVKQFLKRFSPFHRLTYTSLRQQLFRYFNQRKLDLKQQQSVSNHHRLIQLHYLFDWGARGEFNQKFDQLWSTLLNTDPTFAKFGLKIRLHSKHCYLSNALLAPYKTNP